jgi:hypothetical protein
VDFEFRWMIHATPATQEAMLKEIDMFGDSYTRDVTEASLTEVLSYMVRECCRLANGRQSQTTRVLISDRVLCLHTQKAKPKLYEDADPEQVVAELSSGVPFYEMFKRHVFYVDCYSVVGDPKTEIELSPLEVVGLSLFLVLVGFSWCCVLFFFARAPLRWY